MKNILFILLLCPSFIFAQYYGERTTEQNFEESSFYFKPHYLNPFGISSFKNVAPGLINNPFLHLYINPANLPDIGKNDILAYIDFRGDRTEPPVVSTYVAPQYFANSIAIYRPYYDPRWFSISRIEPEPIVSLGILTYPLSQLTRKFFAGGSFQFIHGEDKYYQMPYGIYNAVCGYDAFGVSMKAQDAVPVENRYSGRDDMITDAQLYSVFAGYSLYDNLNIGLSIDGVIHSRDGGYSNIYNDEYGNTDNQQWSNSQSQTRNEDYNHFDISTGISYLPVKSITLGAKAGILTGKAEQSYDASTHYYSQQNTPETSETWYYNYSDNATVQHWNHDGTTKYIGINFSSRMKNDKTISLYYKYSRSNIDLLTQSAINDTSNNSSRWVNSYDGSWYKNYGSSFTHDIRNGSGKRTDNLHEMMLNLHWKLTEKNSLGVGFYISSNNITITSNEPVIAVNESNYNYTSSNQQNNRDYYQNLVEDKTLVWNYSADKFTLQIPILINFRLGKNWGMMLGVNRIFDKWDITDKTVAYFNKRERTIDTTFKAEYNFGEAYTQPEKKMSEKSTKIFASFDASITSAFKARLTIDPDFESFFRIAQWWLSFELKM